MERWHAYHPDDELRRLCGGCDVRLNCLKWAFDQGHFDSLFGGLAGHERAAAKTFEVAAEIDIFAMLADRT